MDRPHGNANFRAPGNVAWVDGASLGMDEVLYLTMLPEGTTLVLAGTARLIWLVAAAGAEALPEVAKLVGLPASQIEADVEHFLADLTSRGLLAPGDPACVPELVDE